METNPYGTQIEALRMRAGLTQGQLAGALRCTQADISNYERGKTRPLPLRFRLIVEYLEALIAGDNAKAAAIQLEAAA